MELLERLVALVPRPRVHLTRYHGVLGPHYKYRKNIVPKKKTELALALASETAEAANTELQPAAEAKEPSTKRMPWAKLLKRVFNIDISLCSKCAGQIKIIAAIEDPKVIKKILEHLGLPWTAPRLAQARGPPPADQSDFFAQKFFEN